MHCVPRGRLLWQPGVCAHAPLGTLRAARRPKGPLSACALWPPSDGLG
jgi:hypothetical protein